MRTRKRECVWDYPRPPRLESTSRHLKVVHAGQVLAETRHAYRVLETSHPPVYYFPPADLARDRLVPHPTRSLCEWKGVAGYLALAEAPQIPVAWHYPRPSPSFVPMADYVAFYPSRVDGCWVDDEAVTAQPGDFYGGWITADLEGPFKGGPGTLGW